MRFECAHDEIVPIEKLVPNPRNRNQHPERQIELLAKIIAHTGQRNPIVVSNRSGFMTKGHGRLLALQKLGWTKAAVDYQDYESEAEEYQDMTADNKIAELAEHDDIGMIADIKEFGFQDLEILGLDDFQLPTRALEPQCDEDEMPETVDTRTKPGDIWKLGPHRLMCGDATDIRHVDALIENDKVELCFTSPPYADQREYNGNKDLSTEHLATFIRVSAHACRYYAVNLGYARKDGEVFEYWDDYIKEAKDNELKFLSWNVWNKGECGSIGNQTAMFGICHEWIFVFGQEKRKLNRTVPNKSAGELANHNGNRQKDGKVVKQKDRIVQDFSQLKTVYDCVPQKERDDINHPARFPVRFPEGYIEAMTKKNQVIYEPFGGSGSTLIAAEKTGRKCLIMELDAKYCDIILSRWEKYTGETAERIIEGENGEREEAG